MARYCHCCGNRLWTWGAYCPCCGAAVCAPPPRPYCQPFWPYAHPRPPQPRLDINVGRAIQQAREALR